MTTNEALLYVYPLLAIVVIPLGLWLIYLGRKQKALAEASAHWPTAPGKVIESGLRERTLPGRGGIPKTYFIPTIRYGFFVGGERYEGHVIQFGRVASPIANDAEKLIAGYAAGATVIVHYRPDDPQVSTLSTSASAANWLTFSGVAVMIGPYILFGIAHVAVTLAGT